jgi:hypothetical protein
VTWVKKRITVVTKAYPEHSTRHGDVACTAGITSEGEWIRLYPIDMRHFIGPNKISKFDVIEVECEKDSDKLSRKESYKIRPESIKIIDRSLTTPACDWPRRNALMMPKVARSIEDLQSAYENDHTSMGLIKPRKLLDFIKTAELKTYENESWSFTVNLDGQIIPKVTKIPHIFQYVFECAGCDGGKHTMQCEDWELFEAYRSWGPKEKNLEMLWAKLRYKFFDWMLEERDLHFIMGTHSQYPVWFIIGIYYPPRRVAD